MILLSSTGLVKLLIQQEGIILKIIKNEVIEQVIDNDLLLVPIIDEIVDMKHVYYLSGSSRIIWPMINNSMTVNELVSGVTNYYGIAHTEEIETDIKDFLNALKEHGVICIEELEEDI